MTCDDACVAGLPESNLRCIFQFLSDSELYRLSITSRCIHQLALTVLLSRRNIADPLDKVDILLDDPTEPTTLHVLRTAQFVPSIRQLVIWFSPGVQNWVAVPFPQLTFEQLQATTHGLLKEMAQISSLLMKLKSVDKITLVCPGSLEWNLRDVYLERGSTADVFSWTPFLGFLQDIVAKQCTSFRVETHPFWTHAIPHPVKASTHRRLFSTQLHFMKRRERLDTSPLARQNGAKYRPQKPPPGAAIRSANRITAININTTLPFFPGAAGWTFSLLKHSPIVALHISGLNISRSDWEVVASKLADAVPNLREFDFDDRRISPDCLIWLLNRLPKLTNLTIVRAMSVYLTHPRIFPLFSAWYLPAFRELTKLSAPWSYVRLFLMRRNPLPVLTFLELPPIEIFYISAKQHESFYVHIPEIIRQLREKNHVLFPLPVTIRLDPYDRFHMLSQHIDMSLALDSAALEPLREITHLVLDGFNSLMDVQCVSRWLRLFPSLQHVSWRDRDHEGAAAANISHLIREISRACPTIEGITAQGVLYSTSVDMPLWTSTAALNLCDLPPEVLLLIFNFLHIELFWVSLLSRRLHFLALPIFLARNCIPNPGEVADLDIGESEDSGFVIRALTISLFVPSIQHLVCRFARPVYFYKYVDNIHRVARLVRKLATMSKLTLHFVPHNYRLGNTSSDGNYAETRIWDACHSAVGDVLKAVHDKCCTSLAIVGCPGTASTTPMFLPKPPSVNVNSISTLSLDVDHHAPYSWWIFMALKNSSLSSLHLTVTESTDLSCIADRCSALSVLSIDGHYAPKKGILDYLAQCTNLTTLTLGPSLSNHASVVNLQVDEPILHLDSLVDLTATVSYISHLFRACDRFSALERLRILVNGLDDEGWTLISLVEGVHESHSSPLAITLEVTNLLAMDMASLARGISCLSFLGGKWMHAARHITGLAVQWHPEWFRPGETGIIDPDNLPILINWFSLFKGSRRIYIQNALKDILLSDSLLEFGKTIGRTIPGVHAVHFQGHTLFER